MSLPKKKSRIITVDGNQYRCMVGPNDGYNLFYAELDQAKGQVIHVYFNMYLDTLQAGIPMVSKQNLKIIKPKDFESIIRQALKLGWTPSEKGKPLVFDLTKDALVKR